MDILLQGISPTISRVALLDSINRIVAPLSTKLIYGRQIYISLWSTRFDKLGNPLVTAKITMIDKLLAFEFIKLVRVVSDPNLKMGGNPIRITVVTSNIPTHRLERIKRFFKATSASSLLRATIPKFVLPTKRMMATSIRNGKESPKIHLSNVGFGKLDEGVFWEEYSRSVTAASVEENLSVLLLLSNPPSFFQLMKDSIKSSLEGRLILKKGKRLSGFDTDHEVVSCYCSSQIRLVFTSLADLEQFLQPQQHLPHFTDLSYPIRSSSLYSTRRINSLQPLFAKLDIRIAFQVEMLLNDTILDGRQIIALLPEIIELESKVGVAKCEKILIEYGYELRSLSRKELFEDQGDLVDLDDLDAGLIRGPKAITDLIDLLELVRKKSKTLPTVSRDVSRAVSITPTGFKFTGPFIDGSNSILRLYGNNDNFIRVDFGEDDQGRLEYDKPKSITTDFIATRFKPFLSNGIQICGRTFEFLAYTGSGLKESSAWFCTPFEDSNGNLIRASTIRDALGDFSKCRSIPAKYFARIGQAFTTSKYAVTLLPNQVSIIPDIEVNHKGIISNFTDGIGKISPALARDVVASLESDGSCLSPGSNTTFQIRLGGSKGMVSVDSRLKGKQIQLRPSMIKFESKSLTLDIACTFKALPAYLNRPFIKLLEDLGISGNVLLRLQKDAVEEVESAKISCKSAGHLLENLGMGINAGFVAVLQLLPKLLEKEVILGKSSSSSSSNSVNLDNSFIQECIKLACTRRLSDIKYKGRIPLPGCYNLVGVIDEDDYLEEGEIYACIRREGVPNLYLEGSIAISRSPTMAPGDIQPVFAIGKPRKQDAPHLRGLFNCVVFSRQGTRSLPSCLAGGDLDGDLYLLITNVDLIPSRFERPSDYTSPVVRKSDFIAQQSMMDRNSLSIVRSVPLILTTSIANHSLNDLTGHVATKHFIIADQSPTGVLDERCQVLAKAHSDAVDYAKSGIPVNSKFLPRGDITKGRPDFLQPEFGSASRKDYSEYYMSEKILGQLYRNIQLDPVYTSTSSNTSLELDKSGLLSSTIMSLFNGHKLVGLPNVELIEHFSNLILPRYSKSLLLISHTHSLSAHLPLSEEEIFIGYITTTSGRDKKVRENMIIKLGEETSSLFSRFKKEITGESRVSEEILKRAWTVWWICKSNSGKDLFGRRSLGFLAYGIMIKLASQ